MALDTISRGLAVQALQRQTRTIEQYGADGSAAGVPPQNTAAFRDALLAPSARLALAGDRYVVAPLDPAEPVRMRRAGQQPTLMIPPGLRLLDGRGATLRFSSSLGILAAPHASYDFPEVRSDIGADVVAGARTITLAAGEGVKWAAGDPFLYRFGSLPFDLPEPLQWGFGTVRAVAGDVLTIDTPMQDSFVRADNATQFFTDEFGTNRLNRCLHKWRLTRDLMIRDLQIVGEPAPGLTETGIIVQGSRRLTLSRIAIGQVGTGIILQYVDGALIDGCAMADSSAGGNLSLNKGIGLAETRGVEVRQFVCSGTISVAAAEANAEATFNGGRFHNTGNPADGTSWGTQCIAFQALGRSLLTVRDYTITGYGDYLLSEVANGAPGYDGNVRFEGRLTLIHATMPTSLGRLIDMNCLLDLRIGGARELWDFTGSRWFTRRIWLKNGEYQNFGLPPGILRQMRIHASAGLSPGTDLTDFYVGRTGDNGASYVGQLVAGKTITIGCLGDGSALFARRAEQLKLLAITASGTGLDAGSQFLDVHCEIVPDLLAPPFAWGNEEDARSLGPAAGLREARFNGTDLPSIAAGASQQADFAIPQMALGDLIESVSLSIDRAGLALRDVQALAGKCRVVFENRTGSAIDLPATTLRIAWRKPPMDG